MRIRHTKMDVKRLLVSEREAKNGNYENPQERRFRKMSFGNLRRVHHAPAHPFSQSTPIPPTNPLFIETSLLVVVVVCASVAEAKLSGEKKLNSMLACNQSIYMIKRFSLNFLFIHHHSPIFPIVAFYIVKRVYTIFFFIDDSKRLSRF